MDRDTARFFLNQLEKMLVEIIKKAKILNNRAVTIPQLSFAIIFVLVGALFTSKLNP
jgi:hypothetical protein